HPKGFPPRPANTRWPKEIKTGNRHRKQLKNLPSLARSIDNRGLLHPLPITPDNLLIAGERRLNAWPITEKYCTHPIPVRVLTIDSVIAGEWDENAEREPFTPEEKVEIRRELERQFAKGAQARQRAGVKAEPVQKGRAADLAARAAGADRKTLDKAAAVVDAAKSGDQRFVKLKDEMNKTGKVNGPFKRLQVIQQKEALLKSPPPLPGNGPY